jgi:hypothetical protein
MGTHHPPPTGPEPEKQRLLREFLELQERYDCELSKVFYSTVGHRQQPNGEATPAPELDELAQAARDAKAAYDAARNSPT